MAPPAPLVAGVDSSTQSTKVEVRELDRGRLVGRGRAPHPRTTPPRSEQSPDDWWAALVAAMASAGADAATRGASLHDVVAISVGAQQHGLVVLDANGAVLRPAKLWNDTESAPEANQLVAQLGASGWAEATGSVPVASFTVTKLAWLARHEPEVLHRVASVLLPHDWLTWRLCGQRVTDRGDASGTGYWSPAEGQWRPDVLELVGLHPDNGWSACLPTVLGPAEAAGTLTTEAATALGLTPGIAVGPGTGDNMAAGLGLGLAPGDVAISLGTSGTVYAASTSPTHDATGQVAGFADATGSFLPLVCTLNATQVTDTVARLLGIDHREFDHVALQAAPGAGGVVLLPYLNGERTPNRPHATGVVAGLRSDVSREQLARAAVEGVVCGLLDGLDALVNLGVDTTGRLLLIGGGAQSTAYRHVVATLAARDVTGAAVQAAAVAAGHGLLDISRHWHRAGDTPDDVVATGPGAAAISAEVRQAYAARRDAEPDDPPRAQR
jgi:xylulokinase